MSQVTSEMINNEIEAYVLSEALSQDAFNLNKLIDKTKKIKDQLK